MATIKLSSGVQFIHTCLFNSSNKAVTDYRSFKNYGSLQKAGGFQ